MTDSFSTVRVRLAGVVRPAEADYTAAFNAWAEAFDQNGEGLPPPRRSVPVFEDTDGKPMVVRNTVDGPIATAILVDLPAAPDGDWANPSFVRFAEDAGYARGAFDRIALAAAANSGVHLPVGSGTPAKDGLFDQLKDAIKGYAAGLSASIGQSVLKETLSQLMMGATTSGLLSSLPGAALGGIPGLAGALKAAGAVSDLASGSTQAAAGSLLSADTLTAGLSQLGDKLLGQWKVEDSDAMGEQLANHVAKKYKDQLKDPEAALDKLKGYFTAEPAPALHAAVRMTDADVIADMVLAGSANVFAEGLPLARIGDPVKPPGMAVYMGGATVLTNGLMTARTGTSVSVIGPFSKGAATVFVNGKPGGTPPPKPPPPPPPSNSSATKSDGKSAAASGGKSGGDAVKKDTQPAAEKAKPTDPKSADAKPDAKPGSAPDGTTADQPKVDPTATPEAKPGPKPDGTTADKPQATPTGTPEPQPALTATPAHADGECKAPLTPNEQVNADGKFTPEEHLSRNKYNQCPATDPGVGTTDDVEWWRKTPDDCHVPLKCYEGVPTDGRLGTGSFECCYLDGSLVDNTAQSGTFNFYNSRDYFWRHAGKDYAPHMNYGYGDNYDHVNMTLNAPPPPDKCQPGFGGWVPNLGGSE